MNINLIVELFGGLFGGGAIVAIIFKLGGMTNKIENNAKAIEDLERKQHSDFKEIRDRLEQIYMILSGNTR